MTLVSKKHKKGTSSRCQIFKLFKKSGISRSSFDFPALDSALDPVDRLLVLVESRGDNGNFNVIFQRRIDAGTEDNVRLAVTASRIKSAASLISRSPRSAPATLINTAFAPSIDVSNNGLLIALSPHQSLYSLPSLFQYPYERCLGRT